VITAADTPAAVPYVCPRCAGALRAVAGFACNSCGANYPVVDGVPWLVPEPGLALADWRNRLRTLLAGLEQQASRYRAALGMDVTRTSTRNRLKLLAAACTDHARRLRALLAPLDEAGAAAAPETYAALGPALSPGQGLTSYYANVHRDWAWGESENASALAAVTAALAGQSPGRTLVLGAGAGRLAFDLHAGLASVVTVAADINPLFAAVARRMYSGEQLELYEFPIAPRDLSTHAVLRKLAAPTPARPGLDFVLADAMQAPFAPGSFHTVVTPWLVDVIDADLADLAAAINGWLAPEGRWVSTGTLFFQQRDAAQCYAAEEVREVVADAGFAGVRWREERVPYLHSPASRHARMEDCVTFVATRSRPAPWRRRPRVPEWQVSSDVPVPLLPAVASRLLSMRVYAFVASLVDGQRSLRDIAAVLVQERLLADDEALGAVREFLRRLHEEATVLPNP
jgi:uncharacterized protein YbaR (Trm112 family)